MKNSSKGLIVLLVALLGFVAAGPFITISAIKSGMVENDTVKLSEYIEFPTLRQNMKDQLNAVVMKNAASEAKGNPLVALVAGFATKMVDGMVDSFITPSGLATLMEGKRLNHRVTTGEVGQPKKEDLFPNARYTYDSMNRFSIWVPNERGEEMRFVLKRDGVSWKLVNLILPASATM